MNSETSESVNAKLLNDSTKQDEESLIPVVQVTQSRKCRLFKSNAFKTLLVLFSLASVYIISFAATNGFKSCLYSKHSPQYDSIYPGSNIDEFKNYDLDSVPYFLVPEGKYSIQDSFKEEFKNVHGYSKTKFSNSKINTFKYWFKNKIGKSVSRFFRKVRHRLGNKGWRNGNHHPYHKGHKKNHKHIKSWGKDSKPAPKNKILNLNKSENAKFADAINKAKQSLKNKDHSVKEGKNVSDIFLYENMKENADTTDGSCKAPFEGEGYTFPIDVSFDKIHLNSYGLMYSNAKVVYTNDKQASIDID
ncbi:hypothetical protein AYI69_g3556, partial [Smittium culicis]